jgi:hypothetical protein
MTNLDHAVAAFRQLTPAEQGPILREASKVLATARSERPGLFSWVYAVQAGDGGPVKIGISDKPRDRLATLQQANHETLIPLAAWHTLKLEEKELHAEYAYAHIRGEWFQPVPELIDYVMRRGDPYEDWA